MMEYFMETTIIMIMGPLAVLTSIYICLMMASWKSQIQQNIILQETLLLRDGSGLLWPKMEFYLERSWEES